MKNIIRYILTIILTIAIIAFLLLKLAVSTVLSEQYILAKLDETDYYNKMFEYVKSSFENYIGQSGMDEEILENIVSKEKIEKDIKIILSNIYDGMNEEINTQEIRDSLNSNIEKSLGSQKLTTAQRASVSTFIDEIINEYTTAMSHTSYEKQINQYYAKIMKYINLAKKAIIVLLGIDLILLLVLSLRRIYRFLVMCGISMLSTGILFSISNWYINTKIKIQTITIFNNAISDAIRNILQEILNTVKEQGLIFIISGVCLIIIPTLIHYFRRFKYEGEVNNTKA